MILNREQNLQQQFKAVQFDAVWSVSSLFSLVVQNQMWSTLYATRGYVVQLVWNVITEEFPSVEIFHSVALKLACTFLWGN